MRISYGEALDRVAERVYENKKSIRQSDLQRRDRVLDLYGIEYYRVGDGGAPARFYISASPDLVYWERFEFKLIIQPFVSTAGSGVTSATVQVNSTTATVKDTSLSVSSSSITPNPHTHAGEPHSHTTNAHTHNINAGVTLYPVTATNFRLSVEGIDITPYLMAQGQWIDGEGVFPSLDIEKNFDLLEVASDLWDEGRETDANKILQSGFKPIEISASGPFSCTLVNYIKYSHMNR